MKEYERVRHNLSKDLPEVISALHVALIEEEGRLYEEVEGLDKTTVSAFREAASVGGRTGNVLGASGGISRKLIGNILGARVIGETEDKPRVRIDRAVSALEEIIEATNNVDVTETPFDIGDRLIRKIRRVIKGVNESRECLSALTLFMSKTNRENMCRYLNTNINCRLTYETNERGIVFISDNGSPIGVSLHVPYVVPKLRAIEKVWAALPERI